MFECFIWLMANDWPCVHWEDCDQSPEEEEAFDKDWYLRVKKKIEAACETAGIEFDMLHFHETYGGIAVSAGFARNHPAGSPERQRAFLEELARTAPATYGVIYMLDSDQKHVRGEFTVLKLAKGIVTQSLELLVPDRPK